MMKYQLPPEDLQALVGYLLSLDFSWQKPVAVERAVAWGGRSFYRRGCLDCHQIRGMGQKRGPDLSEIGKRQSLEELRRYLVEPGLHGRAGTTFPKLSLEEGEDLITYLSALR